MVDVAMNTDVETLSSQLSETELDPAVNCMLARLVDYDGGSEEGPHFRHQSRIDAPLTREEKLAISAALLRDNPGEFLARYSRFLVWPEDGECFRQHMEAGDFTVGFYLGQAGVAFPLASSQQKRREARVKNRRLQVASSEVCFHITACTI